MIVTFTFTGTPVAKGRPRATVRGAASRFATVYTDERTRKFEAAVAKLARLKMGAQPPLVGPLSVSLRFRFEPPKSLSKRARAAMLAGEVAYLGTKDTDNLCKAVLDGLNKIAFADDVQIVRLFATKVAAETAGIDVRVEALSPQPAKDPA